MLASFYGDGERRADHCVTSNTEEAAEAGPGEAPLDEGCNCA